MLKENLTNEKLKGLFRNNFELTNQAIRLARYFIRSGHEVNADELLEEIRRHPSPSYIQDLETAAKADDKHSAKEE